MARRVGVGVGLLVGVGVRVGVGGHQPFSGGGILHVLLMIHGGGGVQLGVGVGVGLLVGVGVREREGLAEGIAVGPVRRMRSIRIV